MVSEHWSEGGLVSGDDPHIPHSLYTITSLTYTITPPLLYTITCHTILTHCQTNPFGFSGNRQNILQHQTFLILTIPPYMILTVIKAAVSWGKT